MADILKGNEPFEALIGTGSHVVLDDLTDREYHGLAAYSASGAKHLLKSAAHFREAMIAPSEPTPAMVLGSLVHLAVLEPQRFAEKVFVSDKGPTREKAEVKAERESREEMMRSLGNMVVSKDQYDIAARIQEQAMNHPIVPGLLAEARREVSFLWRDPQFGIPCKARMDGLRPDGIIVDIKTTADASAEAFGRSCAQFRYDIQAAVYNLAHEMCLASSLKAFVFVAIETSPPFGIATYVTEPNVIAVAMSDVNRTMNAYRDALTRRRWDSYPTVIAPLKFPAWALRRVA